MPRSRIRKPTISLLWLMFKNSLAPVESMQGKQFGRFLRISMLNTMWRTKVYWTDRFWWLITVGFSHPTVSILLPKCKPISECITFCTYRQLKDHFLSSKQSTLRRRIWIGSDITTAVIHRKVGMGRPLRKILKTHHN